MGLLFWSGVLALVCLVAALVLRRLQRAEDDGADWRRFEAAVIAEVEGRLQRDAILGAVKRRAGYTLIEILTATALALVMMTGVVAMLGTVSESISKSRSGLEMMDRLRAAQSTLRRDLENVTTTMLPPRHPESAEGYFEYIEGPIGPVTLPSAFAVNSETGAGDTSVGDFDDILMFTVRSPDVPFVGRYATNSLESREAEVAWFVRGRTLYRRVLLIAPHTLTDLDADGDGQIEAIASELNGESFFNLYDISARPAGYSGNETSWIPNSLADLTKRENRFAHRVHCNDSFPYDARRWGQLGLPTLQECSDPGWMDWADSLSYPSLAAPASTMDLWMAPHPWPEVDAATGRLTAFSGPRIGEDVILTNVIGFDVKAWDPEAPVFEHLPTGQMVLPGDPGYPRDKPGAFDADPMTEPDWKTLSFGAYVDLDYANGNARTGLDRNGHPKSKLNTGNARVYDTWSFHYEHDGFDQDGDGLIDEGTDGFDNDGDGVVDDTDADTSNGEEETRPPYMAPLRGIQVKIRIFEPDGRQVREVTVIQDFLPK